MISNSMSKLYESAEHSKIYEKISHDVGIPALEKLYELSQGTSKEANIIGLFLMSFYDGRRFPFNLQLLKELSPSNLTSCIAIIHLDYNARQEIYQYLGLAVKDFEYNAYRLLENKLAKPIPRKIIVNGRSYLVDEPYIAGANACLQKVASNPYRAFSKKNLQWQFGFDNETNNYHKSQGYFFESITTKDDKI